MKNLQNFCLFAGDSIYTHVRLENKFQKKRKEKINGNKFITIILEII